MKKIMKIAVAVAAASALAACGDSDNDPVVVDNTPLTPPGSAEVRVIHASPDAPIVDVTATDDSLQGLRSFQNLDYQTASRLARFEPTTTTFTVSAELPGGTAADVLTIPATLTDNAQVNVIAIGDVADLDTLLVVNTESAVTVGNIRAQVVHAAPEAPTVDVYVTAFDTDITTEQPLATLAFTEFTGQVEVPAGEYQIRITPAGSTTVVFDSGALDLASGSDLLITATENVGPGASPVALLVADGAGSSVIIDANTPAEVRAIHAVADAPAVDVIAVVEEADDIVLFDGAPFLGVTDYIEVSAGDYVIDVAADADNSIVPIDDAPLSVMAGVRYSAIANNTLANIDLDAVVDDGRRLATAAQVRIFHASPSTPAVDIYVTADGEIAEVEPAFVGVEFSEGTLAETGYVQLAAGDYVVTVTPTGTKTEAIETGVLSLAAGGIYTALAVDGNAEGDAPQLILADDFLAPAAAVMVP
jgi:hypothetical protein